MELYDLLVLLYYCLTALCVTVLFADAMFVSLHQRWARIEEKRFLLEKLRAETTRYQKENVYR